MAEPERIVDADLWPPRPGLRELGPYLPREWREYARIAPDGTLDPTVTFKALPESVFWRQGPALDAAGYLDRFPSARAVVAPPVAGSISGLSNPTFAAAMARAANDWMLASCLGDERLSGSIVVGPRDGELAAGEIHRLAREDRLVQVVLANPPCLLGDRSLHAIYAAATEHGLPVQLQASGAFAGISRGISAAGWPASVFEQRVQWGVAAQPHLLSLIAERVFDRFPDLRVVLAGFGIAWLPSLLWRMDAEAPSGLLSRRPSEYVHRHVRFTTGDIEVPDDGDQLFAVLSQVGAERLLMFGSGARPLTALSVDGVAGLVPPAHRPSILSDAALELYRIGHAEVADAL